MLVMLRQRHGSNEGVDLVRGADRKEEVAARLAGELNELGIASVDVFEPDIPAEVDGTDPVVGIASVPHPLRGADGRVFSEVVEISLVAAFDADDDVTDPCDRRIRLGSRRSQALLELGAESQLVLFGIRHHREYPQRDGGSVRASARRCSRVSADRRPRGTKRVPI
jgi:hypothetical protein